jgi:hypothetical protein
MESNIRRIVGTLVVIGLVGLSGCDAQKPQPAAPSHAQQESVTRTAAIQNAQTDAAFRYAEVQVARVEARRQGGYWVVELTSPTGSGLRYTISALDGSIRERNTFQ